MGREEQYSSSPTRAQYCACAEQTCCGPPSHGKYTFFAFSIFSRREGILPIEKVQYAWSDQPSSDLHRLVVVNRSLCPARVRTEWPLRRAQQDQRCL